MPTVTMDLSPVRYQLHNIDPQAEGASNLLAALIKGPIERQKLQAQRQHDEEQHQRELWQMHRADEGFAREGQWHDQAQQQHLQEYARAGQWHDDASQSSDAERAYQHGRSDTEDARRTMNDWLTADYRKQALTAKGARGRGPQPGDVAQGHVVQSLTTELVQVPKVDAFGDVVKGPDGQPLMTYARQPVKDREKRLRAAGIDPQTLRYADAGSLQQDEPQMDYALDAPTEGDLKQFHGWAQGPGGPNAPAAAPPAAAPSAMSAVGDWLGKLLGGGASPSVPDNGEVTGNDFNPPGDPSAPEPAAPKVMPRAILNSKAKKAGITPAAAEKHYTGLGFTIGD